MYRAGDAHKGSKSSPGLMHEKLTKIHPNKLVPGILEIAAFVSAITQVKNINSEEAIANLLYTREDITVALIPEVASFGEHCLRKANVKVLREFLTSRQQPDDGLKPVLVARVLALCNTEV